MSAILGAAFTIEGGTMNVAGRLTGAAAVTYTQSGGTVNICVAGGCTTVTGCVWERPPYLDPEPELEKKTADLPADSGPSPLLLSGGRPGNRS